MVYIKVHLLLYSSMGFDKHKVMYSLFSPIQKTFTAPKVPCVPRIHLSFPSTTPENHWSFCCFHSFAFSRMPNSWNHIVYILSEWLLSLGNVLQIFTCILCVLITHFLLSLNRCADSCVDVHFWLMCINPKEHNAGSYGEFMCSLWNVKLFQCVYTILPS